RNSSARPSSCASLCKESLAMSGGQSPAGTVLVIDDNDRMRRSLQRSLERFGFAVAPAASGEEALAVLAHQAHQIDGCLLDQQLGAVAPGEAPALTGMDTLLAIRRRHPRLRVVVFTGQDQHQALEAVNLGATLYVHKPFEIE